MLAKPVPVKPDAPAPSSVRLLFTENLGLKITSILVSVLLFSVFRGAEDAQRSVLVDVVAELPPESDARILTSDLPAKVRLTLRGSRSLLNSIRADDLPPIEIDLSETQASVYYFEPERFEVPAGVEIAQVSPDALPLTWVDRTQRAFPVFARLEGRPDPGMMVIGEPTVRPATVVLRGPTPDLAGMDRIVTEPIQLAGLAAGRYERRVAIPRLPTHVQFVGDASVTVQFEIAPEIAERAIPRLDVATVGGPVRELRPVRVRVLLRGPPVLLDAIDPQSIVPYVDGSALDAEGGAQSILVRVRGIPDGVELAGVDPEEVLATPAAPAAPHH